jgi:hypothetical protein
MAERETSRNLSAKVAVECLRSNMSNGELMQKFKISPSGFADLLRQLYEKKLISEQDMARRGIRFKVTKKSHAPEQVAVTRPAPVPSQEEPEEFLDTVSLTELLSSGVSEPPQCEPTCEEVTEIEVPEDTKTDSPTSKKSRFNIGGLFKKGS